MAVIISNEMVMTPSLKPGCQFATIVWRTCGRDNAPSRDELYLEINQHDDERFYFDLTDQDGNAILVDDLVNLTFIVLAGHGGHVALVTKSMTAGDIVKSGNSQVYTDISYLESGSLAPGRRWCEMRGQAAGPTYQTMGAGTLKVIDTDIGDIL